MNCQSFENMIDDVARARLMDAALRDEALAHTADCARCSARLEDERALTAGLVAVASRDSESEAPSRVESALLAAFRERHAAPAPQEAYATVAPLAGATPRAARASVWWMPRWAQGAAVAAASMLLVFGLYGLLRNPGAVSPGERAGSAGPAAGQGARTEAENASRPTEAADNSTVASANAPDETDEEAGDPDEPVAPRGLGRPAPRQGYQFARASYSNRRPRPTPASDAAESEITTEYIPLMNGGQLTPGDAGHVVRVEMPRTALASFGLPVNADRAEARVKADVLMGEDGMARAIRFVR